MERLQEGSESNLSPSSAAQQPKQLWEVWPGRNQPVCGGSCFCGPDLGIWMISVSLISVPSLLFAVFVAPKVSVALSVLVIPFWFASLFLLCKASFTEPGILPRGIPDTSIDLENPPTIQVEGESMIRLRYCPTCHIWRPPRSKHCRDCDNCVDSFDHHCPWISNCVGLRNYRYFVGFIFATTALCVYVFFVSAVHFGIQVQQSSDFSSVISQYPFTSGIMIFCFLMGWCLCSLTCFHCHLIANDQTTNERIKSEARTRENPGYCSNLRDMFCVPVPPSKIDLQRHVDPKDQAYPPLTLRRPFGQDH